MPGVEPRMEVLYEGGVNQGRIGLNRFVEITATTPAKMFGLYPKKGTIAPGGDADIVIFDPNAKHVISVDNQHMRVDYSAYEGMEVTGKVVSVLSRGRCAKARTTWHRTRWQPVRGRGRPVHRAGPRGRPPPRSRR
jgi:dihydropyrimidinase